jgi:hypothetical protein
LKPNSILNIQKITHFILVSYITVPGTHADPSDAACLEKLRSEVEADITRLVGVFLVNNGELIAQNAKDAARRMVTRERISQGTGIVDPVATAVESSVAETFENLSWEVKNSIKVYVKTELMRLCALENCCFGGN